MVSSCIDRLQDWISDRFQDWISDQIKPFKSPQSYEQYNKIHKKSNKYIEILTKKWYILINWWKGEEKCLVILSILGLKKYWWIDTNWGIEQSFGGKKCKKIVKLMHWNATNNIKV